MFPPAGDRHLLWNEAKARTNIPLTSLAEAVIVVSFFVKYNFYQTRQQLDNRALPDGNARSAAVDMNHNPGSAYVTTIRDPAPNISERGRQGIIKMFDVYPDRGVLVYNFTASTRHHRLGRMCRAASSFWLSDPGGPTSSTLLVCG